MADIGESPQDSLPRFDVGGRELFLAELRAQRIQQHGRLRASECLAEDLEVLGAQPVGAAAALQRIEIFRERQTPVSGAGVELDALGDSLRAIPCDCVFRVNGTDSAEGFIRPILRRSARRPAKPVRGENGVRGDVLGSAEILREQRGRHDERRAGVRESFACGAIDGELAEGIERLHARQIADRVAVFHVRQPPQHHGAGIARVGERHLVEHRPHPAGEQLHLLRRRLRLVLWRHLAVANLFQRSLPHDRIVLHKRDRRESLQVQIPLLLLRRVARDAILLQHRPDGLLEDLPLIGKGMGGKRRDGNECHPFLAVHLLAGPHAIVRLPAGFMAASPGLLRDGDGEVGGAHERRFRFCGKGS